MENSHLKTFIVVANTLHFTRAAEILHLTQPAVSHQIKSLENELGQELFVRGKNEIIITEAGKVLFDYANKSLDLLDEAKTKIDEIDQFQPKSLKISSVTNSLNNIFGQLQQIFRKKYKNFDLLFFNANNGQDIIDMILNREIDIGFIKDGRNIPNLTQIPFVSTEFLYIAGNNHQIFEKPNIKLNDLVKEEWILFEKNNGFREATDSYFEMINFHPLNLMETNDGFFLLELIKMGGKISLLPEAIVKEQKLKTLKIDAPKFTVQLNAAFHKSKATAFYYEFLETMFEADLSTFTRLYQRPKNTQ